jgi:hypothetical protein
MEELKKYRERERERGERASVDIDHLETNPLVFPQHQPLVFVGAIRFGHFSMSLENITMSF